MRAIFAADPADTGTIVLDGRPRRFRSIREAVRAGIAYVPEDRKTQGLFLDQSLEDNIVCGNFDQCSWKGIVLKSLSRKFADDYCRRFRIGARGIDQEVRTLSGGNQQKTLLAHWSAALPKVFIVDEPTRGIDVGAKAEIHRLLRQYADAGNGIIVVSSEMPELIGLCDRILVLHEGRLAGEAAGSGHGRSIDPHGPRVLENLFINQRSRLMIVTGMGKQLRMRRIFRKGKVLVLPLDHPIYFGPQEGTEDPARLLALARDHGATAVLLTAGALRQAVGEAGDLGIIMRIDATISQMGGPDTIMHLLHTPRRPPPWGPTWSC